MDEKSKIGYIWALIFVVVLAAIGFYTRGDENLIDGFIKIMLASDILITDYFVIAGVGATFLNVSLVTLITIMLMYINRIPFHGGGVVTIGLMAGFSFFGKNIFNMWFILFGTYLFCLIKKEKFAKYINLSLLSTALGPLISSTFFYGGKVTFGNATISLLCGITIGFVIPMLSAHTEKLLHGLNLYNGGFALGLLALVLVPILNSYGFVFLPVQHWATGYNSTLGLGLYTASAVLILGGITEDKYAIKNYFNILKRPGYPSEDFIELDGMGAVLINMGVNGIIATTYILLIGGNLNGPTLGGIFTIIGFSAKGKHARNILPVMIGVAIGGVTKNWAPMSPTAQLAALFGTTLAPIAGTYGAIAGVIAGFLHSSVALQAGLGYSGINLYNNGFAGGVVSIVMYSILTVFLKPRLSFGPSESMRNANNEVSENGDIMYL